MERAPYFPKVYWSPKYRPHTSSMTCIQQFLKHTFFFQDNSIRATPVAQSRPTSRRQGGSLYLPWKSSLDVTPDSCSTMRDDSMSLTKLNEFLDSRDVSLARHTVTVSWSDGKNASSPSSQGTTGSRCCLGGSCAQAIREVVACSCSIFESTIPHWLWKRG